MKKFWYEEEVQKLEHSMRIGNVLDIKQYLLRLHKILNRPDFMFKEETFSTAKIVLNTLKSIVNFHTAYIVGNPISLTGENDIVSDFNKVYKKGLFSKTDYNLTSDLYKFGNAFEYVYLDKCCLTRKTQNFDTQNAKNPLNFPKGN